MMEFHPEIILTLIILVLTYGQVEDYTVNITSSARMEASSNYGLSFTLYPNPVNGEMLNIANLDGDATFRIFNMMGQELGKGTIENQSIYVGSLQAGTYLVEVSNANATLSKRFIKQ